MKKILAILGVIVLLIMLFAAPWATLALAGVIGAVVALRKFFYFRNKREPEKAKLSAMVLGASVVAFAVGGYLMPPAAAEKEAAKLETVQTTTKKTAESSKIEELVLSLSKEALETDSTGTIMIQGTTEPHATVYIATETSDKKVEADGDGNFELSYILATNIEEELEVIAELNGQKMSKLVTATPSTAFVAAREAEAEKEAEELRLAKEAEEKQQAEADKKAETDRLIKEAEAAVAQAESNQTHENVASATTAIAAIPEGDQVLSTRVAAVDTAIHAREEQEAQQAAAAAAEAEQAVQQEQNNVTEMVLVTPTGSKYHNRRCGNGTYTEATLQTALSRNLTPCSKCFG